VSRHQEDLHSGRGATAGLPGKLAAPLTPAALQRRIGSASFGHRIYYYQTIGSTNERALELVAAGEPEGSLVLAEEQTAGRGRRDRSWTSRPYLGIYASLIIRPSIAAPCAPQFTLLAAVSAAVALRLAGGQNARIKWPNDLVVGRRKIAGVLGEVRGSAAQIREMVIGVGINVNHVIEDFPAALRHTATSVRIETGAPGDRVTILATLLEQLEGRYRRLLNDGPESLLREWESLSSLSLGREIVVRGASNPVRGVFRGIDQEGALLLTGADGATIRAPFGEVETTPSA
jgi:BirA family biotin operon repressor/biotin-[acetyl-CoA-carboxylase] ligase